MSWSRARAFEAWDNERLKAKSLSDIEALSSICIYPHFIELAVG